MLADEAKSNHAWQEIDFVAIFVVILLLIDRMNDNISNFTDKVFCGRVCDQSWKIGCKITLGFGLVGQERAERQKETENRAENREQRTERKPKEKRTIKTPHSQFPPKSAAFQAEEI